jgi:hypothetical protein
MAKNSKLDIDRVLNSIRKIREDNPDMTSEQIRLELAIPKRSFTRYIQTIHKEDKEAWQSVTKTQLELEYFKLKASYEDTYKTAVQEVRDAKTTQDRLLACETKDNARLDIIRLIQDSDIKENVTETEKQEIKPKREIPN